MPSARCGGCSEEAVERLSRVLSRRAARSLERSEHVGFARARVSERAAEPKRERERRSQE